MFCTRLGEIMLSNRSLFIGIGLWILKMIDLLIIWVISKILNQLIVLICVPCLEKLEVMNLLKKIIW